jgi:DNA-binding CsgD family transcriptional regulator
VLRFVAAAEDLGANQLFTPELLVELGQLIDADWVTYSELDRVRRRPIYYACRPDEDEELDNATQQYWDDLYWAIAEEHPICCSRRYGMDTAVKLSDFVTLSELRRSRVYALWFRPLEIERELVLAIPGPQWHTKALIFDRTKGRDFSDRDRLVLDLLRPHLTRLSEAARTRRLLERALVELERADENDVRGVILLDPVGHVELVTPPAARLLREFFPAVPAGRVPQAIADWLKDGAERSLTRSRGERRLVVERDADWLLLEEQREEVQLTARERDVLSWVARGKTNAEIAELLWLAPSTVRKHLENVYTKLGVRTRTAAVARFLGRIDAEAS